MTQLPWMRHPAAKHQFRPLEILLYCFLMIIGPSHWYMYCRTLETPEIISATDYFLITPITTGGF